MCGIFGYVGTKQASSTILTGLKRLEYRGYDSWGIAVKHNGSLDVTKDIGAIGDIDLSDVHPRACIGIGHTRWATHGGTTVTNAHPHFATDKSFVLAQNGIVENYQHLKDTLTKKEYVFNTQTDTEVIVRLIEHKRKTSRDLRNSVRKAFLELAGRNTIIVLSAVEEHIIAVRNGSPLVVGIGKDEYFFSSDTLSFADRTNKVVVLNNNQMAEYRGGRLNFYDIKTGKAFKPSITRLDHTSTTIDKEGYDHYMLKEIVEQQHTIREAIQYSEKDLAPLVKAIKDADTVYTVGAGTASFAAGQVAYLLRKIGHVHAVELKSYEVDSYRELFSKKDVIIAVSQSGETADTIEALEYAKENGTTIASIVNMVGSTIIRMSDLPYLSRSGPEICVASTKAFTAQIAWGFLLSCTIADRYKDGHAAIYSLSRKLESYFNDDLFKHMRTIASSIKKHDHFFILGKGQHYYTALEGALKIKEITYKHFEGFASGELKHGVIALVDKGTPVFTIVAEDENKDDMLTAAAEVKARGAWVVGVTSGKNTLFDDILPCVDGGLADPIAKIVPFQLLSYYLGVELGNNVDRPRNLAKSVTVK